MNFKTAIQTSLLLIALLCTGPSFMAQTSTTGNPPAKHALFKSRLYSLTELNFGLRIDDRSTNYYLSPYIPFTAGISSVVGLRLVRRLQIGIGAGVDVTPAVIFFPVFADLRLRTSLDTHTPYVGLAAGYAFGTPFPRSYFDDHCQGGFFFYPSVGGRFQLNAKTALHVGIGLRAQESRFKHDGYNRFGNYYEIRFATVNIRTGLEF